MNRWTNRWNTFWFPMSSSLDLAICRFITVGAALVWIAPTLHSQLDLLKKNSQFIHPQLLIRAIVAIAPREVLFTSASLTFLYWVTVLTGVTAFLGCFTRISLGVFSLGIWILIAHKYSYGDVHHPDAVFSIFLMTLAFSPSGDRLSLDALMRRRQLGRVDTALWPLKLSHFLLAMGYFSTGLSKMLIGGFAWLNGYTLQRYMFSDALTRGMPLGLWLAQHRTLCVWLSVYTVLFELTFLVSFILPRTAPFFFINAILFQTGLYFTGRHNFFLHIVLLILFLFFLDPSWWRAWLNRSSRPKP